MNQRAVSFTRLDKYHLLNTDIGAIAYDKEKINIMDIESNNDMLQGKGRVSFTSENKGDTLINIGKGDESPLLIDNNSAWSNVLKTLSPNTGSQSQRRIKRAIYIVILVVMIVVLLTLVRSGNSKLDITITRPPTMGTIFQDNSRTEYPLVAVADRDKFSFDKEKIIWKSVLLHGILVRGSDGKYSVSWDIEKQVELTGKLAEQTRGLELSELKRFNGKLYTFDDRTGIVYEIMSEGNKHHVIGRHILPDGNGDSTKGFKCEWATVKDGKLWVGSIGKEWTTGTGKIISHDPMWVKTIDSNGHVEHVDFIQNYEALRKAVGASHPGYLVHEAAEWSDFHKRWFFLPRRVSSLMYNEDEDIKRGSNLLISASEDFSHIYTQTIGTITPTRGFSTMKFIPGRPNEIVAIKSEEVDDKMKSYIMVFSLDGTVLLPETLIADEKVEGLEIS
jgi:soluble calcium-activated nucleotidase 1